MCLGTMPHLTFHNMYTSAVLYYVAVTLAQIQYSILHIISY